MFLSLLSLTCPLNPPSPFAPRRVAFDAHIYAHPLFAGNPDTHRHSFSHLRHSSPRHVGTEPGQFCGATLWGVDGNVILRRPEREWRPSLDGSGGKARRSSLDGSASKGRRSDEHGRGSGVDRGGDGGRPCASRVPACPWIWEDNSEDAEAASAEPTKEGKDQGACEGRRAEARAAGSVGARQWEGEDGRSSAEFVPAARVAANASNDGARAAGSSVTGVDSKGDGSESTVEREVGRGERGEGQGGGDVEEWREDGGREEWGGERDGVGGGPMTWGPAEYLDVVLDRSGCKLPAVARWMLRMHRWGCGGEVDAYGV